MKQLRSSRQKLYVYGRLKGRSMEILYDRQFEETQRQEADAFRFSDLPYWYR